MMKKCDLERPKGFIDSQTEALFRRWIDTSDIIDSLSPAIFFYVINEEASGKVYLHSNSKSPVDFASLNDAKFHFKSLTDQLAESIPSHSIMMALSRPTEEKQDQLAREKIDVNFTPTSILAVFPYIEPMQTEEKNILERFRRTAPKPARQVLLMDAYVYDRTAVRRIAFGPFVYPPPIMPHCVESAELASERMPNKIIMYFQWVNLSPFPIELRSALASTKDFIALSRTYAIGQIIKKKNHIGESNRFYVDIGENLTTGDQATLASGPVNYIWDIKLEQSICDDTESEGVFSPLSRWLEEKDEYPSDDVWTLAAINISLEEAQI